MSDHSRPRDRVGPAEEVDWGFRLFVAVNVAAVVFTAVALAMGPSDATLRVRACVRESVIRGADLPDATRRCEQMEAGQWLTR